MISPQISDKYEGCWRNSNSIAKKIISSKKTQNIETGGNVLKNIPIKSIGVNI